MTLLVHSRYQEGSTGVDVHESQEVHPGVQADAVQFSVVGNRLIAQVARDLEINESSLGYWVETYRRQNPDPSTAPLPVGAARIAALEAEVRRLAEENAFLEKAAAFFAKTQP